MCYIFDTFVSDSILMIIKLIGAEIYVGIAEANPREVRHQKKPQNAVFVLNLECGSAEEVLRKVNKFKWFFQFYYG